MAMWIYVPDRKLTAGEARTMPKDKACLACGAKVWRLAERADYYPYVWVPDGWICSKCNLCYMGVP